MIQPSHGQHVYVTTADVVAKVRRNQGNCAVVDCGKGHVPIEHELLVVPSKHACDRLWSRGKPALDKKNSCELATEWRNGRVVGDGGLDADEVRYSEKQDAVLLRQENAIATFIPRPLWMPSVQDAVDE